MTNESLVIEPSGKLFGQAELIGAKNAVLVIMASLILTEGVSVLSNVPDSHDVRHMILLLQDLGAHVTFDAAQHCLTIDTRLLAACTVKHELMKKMRASILVMGPLLARFGQANVAMPGGCVIGARPVNLHLENFKKMGITIEQQGDCIVACADALKATRLVLEYPSVGATENTLMAALVAPGTTRILNAALEPEVMDLIAVLQKMGARITVKAPACIEIEGGAPLQPIEHAIVVDRLEAGALLLAAAVTGGEITIPDAQPETMDLFLMKLQEMGHVLEVGSDGVGIWLKASDTPKAVSFKTAPYPGFPTDLQAPMMAAQCVAEGTSIIEEAVFENRLLHAAELQKMGAQIKLEHNKAYVTGVQEVYGAQVIATDIRASCALVLMGLVAKGTTVMSGIHHFRRGYDGLEKKLRRLGALVHSTHEPPCLSHAHDSEKKRLYT